MKEKVQLLTTEFIKNLWLIINFIHTQSNLNPFIYLYGKTEINKTQYVQNIAKQQNAFVITFDKYNFDTKYIARIFHCVSKNHNKENFIIHIHNFDELENSQKYFMTCQLVIFASKLKRKNITIIATDEKKSNWMENLTYKAKYYEYYITAIKENEQKINNLKLNKYPDYYFNFANFKYMQELTNPITMRDLL